MKSANEVIVTIRKIQCLRAAKSFAQAVSEDAAKKISMDKTKMKLNEAMESVSRNDSCAGLKAKIVLSQLAIYRHPALSRLLRDAEGFFNLASHESHLAQEKLAHRRRELAGAQGALDVARRLASRRLIQQKAREQYLLETRSVEQWIDRRCTKTGHGV